MATPLNCGFACALQVLISVVNCDPEVWNSFFCVWGRWSSSSGAATPRSAKLVWSISSFLKDEAVNIYIRPKQRKPQQGCIYSRMTLSSLVAGQSQQRRRGSILWWQRSHTSARAPLGDGSRASLCVSERCSISHITCTSSYAHIWMSSCSFTRVPRPSESKETGISISTTHTGTVIRPVTEYRERKQNDRVYSELSAVDQLFSA